MRAETKVTVAISILVGIIARWYLSWNIVGVSILLFFSACCFLQQSHKPKEEEQMKRNKTAAIIAIGIIFILIVLVVGGVANFLTYENWNGGINLPYSFVSVFFGFIACLSAAIIAGWFLCNDRREIKNYLLCKQAKIARRWQHFIRQHRKAKFRGDIPLQNLIGKKR